MECPFELPVRLNKKGHFVCGEGKSYRDLTPRLSMLSQNKTYIVCAINSHEKLVEYARHKKDCHIGCRIIQSEETEGCTCGLEQALKEAEKQ